MFYKFDNKILLFFLFVIDFCGRYIINIVEIKKNWNINVLCIFCFVVIKEISNVVYWFKVFYIFFYLIIFMLMIEKIFFVIWFFFFMM